MARWKLMAAHYLNVPGEKWEYTENDRKTGRVIRQAFKVPRLLDPTDPTCWTNRWGTKDDAEGEIIVCHEGKGQSTDQIFFGDPTPDMVPLDDEARELSASFEDKWRYKPEVAPQSFSQSLIDKFQLEQAALVAAKPAQVEGMDKLTEAITELVKSNQTMLKAVTVERRV